MHIVFESMSDNVHKTRSLEVRSSPWYVRTIKPHTSAAKSPPFRRACWINTIVATQGNNEISYLRSLQVEVMQLDFKARKRFEM